jgi:hypothetical protein
MVVREPNRRHSMFSNTAFSVPVIAASLLDVAVASALPASAQQATQTEAQKRYEAYAACRRQADAAVPLANMISEQATLNHYEALANCLQQRGYNIAITGGGNTGPVR